MIRDFDEWSVNLAEMSSMDKLSGAVVGIEATEYLNRLPKLPVPEVDRPIKEALLAALGGLPFGLKFVIKKTISVWKQHGITPVFVFSGLDVGRKDASFAASEESARINAQAWALYDNHQADAAVETFSNSSSVTAEHLFRYLQSILREEGVDFQVAPYGAWAQLAYLWKTNCVDTVAGSSELLLFDVPEIITSWDFKSAEFTWVRRNACRADLGNISPDVFVDACILAGTSLLPTLPQLDAPTARKQSKIRGAVDMIMSMGRTGHSVCLNYQDDAQIRSMDYLDRYRRVRLAIQHHVVLTSDGKVEPFDVEHAPGDIHEFIGQRLPEELYFYLSKGVIGPRVLNWRTSGEIIEPPPLDNGDSEEFRTLVRDQLDDMRTSAISLLSYSLHRFYQHKDVKLRCWFDKENPKIISMRDLPNPLPIVRNWNVRDSVFGPEMNKLQGSGLLGIAVKSLKDNSFAHKTITEKDSSRPLRSKDEVLLNSMWRLLHLRGYLDNEHRLTSWGNVLYTTLSAVPSPELEEAAVIAIELARLGLLNANPMFPTYSGAPYRGSETVKRNTLLIARIGCLGSFQHQEIGYTGPLSRHLLGYHSMISAVRSSLRDLAEVCLTTVLLNGDADRDRHDYAELGLDLPFLRPNDCALGLMVNAYLDEVAASDDPTSSETKKTVRDDGAKRLFKYSSNYEGDLDKAFKLWDAIYKGVETAGDMFKDRKLFQEADKWLAELR